MPSRRVLLLCAAGALSLLLVVAVGLSRTRYEAGGATVACPDRVWSTALEGLTDQDPDPCAAAALERVYAVTAGVLGLVLITGLLSRRG